MELDPIKFAQSKTRDAWLALWKGYAATVRELVRNGGEKVVLAAFVLGIVAVLLFKVVLAIAVVVGLVCCGIYWIAPKEQQ